MPEQDNSDLVELATELTVAWLSNPNNRLGPDDVPAFLRTMHATVSDLATGAAADSNNESAEQPNEYVPAVTARKSLASKDHIISMIDGKPHKALRRHLTKHGLSPNEYRKRYGLKADYPMVAPAYAEMRRDLAKKMGLGYKGRRSSGARAQGGSSEKEAKPAARAPKPRARKAEQA